MALTRAQYLSGNTSNGVVLSGQPQGVRPGGAGITIAADGTISVNAATILGVVKLNNASAYNAYVWPTATASVTSGLTVDGSGNLSWVPFGTDGGFGTVNSVQVSGGTTGLVFSGGPVTTSGTMTMSGVLGVANGGTGTTTSAGAINNLLPSQSGQAGAYLSTDGTNTLWVDPDTVSVTRVIAGSNITISPSTGVGVVTINSTGGGGSGTITGVTAGTGLSGGGTSGTVTLNNTGVLSTTGGTGISVSSSSGNVTISNSGVTSLAGGDGVTVSAATGSVTVSFDIANLPALP